MSGLVGPCPSCGMHKVNLAYTNPTCIHCRQTWVNRAAYGESVDKWRAETGDYISSGRMQAEMESLVATVEFATVKRIAKTIAETCEKDLANSGSGDFVNPRETLNNVLLYLTEEIKKTMTNHPNGEEK